MGKASEIGPLYGKERHKELMNLLHSESIGGMYQDEMKNGNNQPLPIQANYNSTKSLAIRFLERVIHLLMLKR